MTLIIRSVALFRALPGPVVTPLLRWLQTLDGNPLVAVARANLRIPVLVDGDDDHAGPSPSHRTQRLVVQVPGRLDGGFVVDGPWAMEQWPEKWRPGYLSAWRESQHRPAPRGE